MRSSLVIGSRGSKLALVQTELVIGQLRRQYPSIELRTEIIKTTGDIATAPLSVIGGKGVFTKELEDALLEQRIDIAVHSLKDLPGILPEHLQLSAICERENCFDALVLNPKLSAIEPSIRNLPEQAIVGTSSPRRTAQLRNLRPDLVIKDVRGNIDTRLRKLDEGQYDALVLAVAGLKRLGLQNRITGIVSAEEMLPAVGQGAIALETRADDQFSINVASSADHKDTRAACNAERAFLRALGGGCQLPIAGHAEVSGDELFLEGLLSNISGSEQIRDQLRGSVDRAEQIGTELGMQVLKKGSHLLQQ